MTMLAIPLVLYIMREHRKLDAAEEQGAEDGEILSEFHTKPRRLDDYKVILFGAEETILGKTLMEEFMNSTICRRVLSFVPPGVTGEIPSQVDRVDRHIVELKNIAPENQDVRNLMEYHSSCFWCLKPKKKNFKSESEWEDVMMNDVIRVAKTAKASGVDHFNYVSHPAANEEAEDQYLQLEAKVEKELKKLRFDRLTIFRVDIQQQQSFFEKLTGSIPQVVQVLSRAMKLNSELLPIGEIEVYGMASVEELACVNDY